MATRKKAVKKYTMAEFRAWLEGIEEIQPSDWSPDANQWKMIRQKIDNIVETVVEKVVEKTVQPTSHVAPPGRVAIPQAEMQNDGWTPPTPGPASTSLPEMTPAAKAALTGKLPKEMVNDPNTGKSVTPNIDTSTSKDSYESSFG